MHIIYYHPSGTVAIRPRKIGPKRSEEVEDGICNDHTVVRRHQEGNDDSRQSNS